jgi:hypothetical protein
MESFSPEPHIVVENGIRQDNEAHEQLQDLISRKGLSSLMRMAMFPAQMLDKRECPTPRRVRSSPRPGV